MIHPLAPTLFITNFLHYIWT